MDIIFGMDDLDRTVELNRIRAGNISAQEIRALWRSRLAEMKRWIPEPGEAGLDAYLLRRGLAYRHMVDFRFAARDVRIRGERIMPAVKDFKITWNPRLRTLDANESTAARFGIKIFKRARSWRVFGSVHPTKFIYAPNTGGPGRIGNRAVNDNRIRCCAFLRSPRTLEAWIHDRYIKLRAPDGMVWGLDSDGIYLERGVDRYHPTALDLLKGAGHILFCLEKDAQNRKAAKRLREIEAAELHRVWVSLQDSLDAGNCRAVSNQVASQIAEKLGATGELGAVRADYLLSHRRDSRSIAAVHYAARRLG